LFVRFAH